MSGCNEVTPQANPLEFIQQGDAAHAYRWVQKFTPAAFPMDMDILGTPR